MKKIATAFNLIFITLTLFCQTVSAQAPLAIPYQAVARDNTGAILLNQSITLRFTLHDISSNGNIVYQEIQNVTTNGLGLFTVHLGQGSPVYGTLAAINWQNGAKYLQVEFDANGGNNFADMGTTQLMSVPYALHAASSSDQQWQANGNHISNLNTGHVGIGITQPDGQLHINDANGTQMAPSANLVLSRVWNTANDTRASSIFHYYNWNTGNDNLGFGISGGGSTNASPISLSQIKMMIQGDGKVGIGTLTPQSKLSIVDSASQTAIHADIENGDALIQLKSPSVTNWTRLGTNGSPLAILTQGSDKYGSSPTMFLTNNGNIGIGNTDPKSLLDVRGDISMGAWYENNGSRKIGIYNGVDFTGGMEIENTSLSGNYSQKVHFVTHHMNNGYGRRMTIDEDGNVGIGTTAPVAKLTVAGQVRANTYGYGFEQNDGTVSVGTYTDGVAGWVGTNSNHPLYFYTGNGFESMAITTAGDIGIGTSTPAYKLGVTGTTGLHGNTTICPSLNGSLGTVSIGTSTLFTNSMFNVKSNLPYAAFIDGAATTNAALQVEGRTKLNGNVSIGSGAGFATGYRLSVDGKIICTELRVQATPFPDYVFAADYKLKTLEEVEEYITTNHRLPNMPAATEVEAEGMSVGGIQLKLVEKVEELTLYILKQQKQLQEQQAEIDQLNKALRTLKN